MAACGDDDDSADTGGTETTAGDTDTTATDTSGATETTAGSTDTTGGGAVTPPSGEPIRIAWFAPETGPNAVDGRHNALELAIAEINAAGGILGRPLEYEAYDAQFTPDQAVTAMELALSEDPDVLMGLFVTAQVKAVEPLVRESGLPLLHYAQSNELDLSELGLESAFRINVSVRGQTTAWVRYMLEELQPETVGLLNSTDDNSHLSGSLIEEGLTAGGVDVVRREVAADSTDVTEAVLAMTDVDITASNSFPIIDSLFIRQLEQNGVSVPHLTSTGGSQVLAGQLNPPEELMQLQFMASCEPVFDTPGMADFRDAYVAEYGSLAVGLNGTGTPASYDAVYWLKAAMEAANSAEPADVIAALETTTHDGICGLMESDEDHNPMHAMGVVGTSDGTIDGVELIAYYPEG